VYSRGRGLARYNLATAVARVWPSMAFSTLRLSSGRSVDGIWLYAGGESDVMPLKLWSKFLNK
jgi:hypothetical protein